MKRYKLRFTIEAEEDLERLYDFLLQYDVQVAERAVNTIHASLDTLRQFPFICRKAADGAHGARIRELVITFGASGFVALFEIDNDETISITAVRHQRESDYH